MEHESQAPQPPAPLPEAELHLHKLDVELSPEQLNRFAVRRALFSTETLVQLAGTGAFLLYFYLISQRDIFSYWGSYFLMGFWAFVLLVMVYQFVRHGRLRVAKVKKLLGTDRSLRLTLTPEGIYLDGADTSLQLPRSKVKSIRKRGRYIIITQVHPHGERFKDRFNNKRRQRPRPEIPIPIEQLTPAQQQALLSWL